MGRHSAPDDPDDSGAGAGSGVDTIVDDEPVGRHAARPDPAPATLSGTRADLRLLRASAGVRWACLGAVVFAFALYTLVIVLAGASYALWVWTPILLSGVLVGAVLDVAHRRVSRR